jgi:hypothetical protein
VSNGQGSITSRRYTCLLAAQSTNKCFVGTFGNLGTITAANGDTVSANLPIQLTGLRSNWSACFQRQSATPLTRLIPVDASGNGYASIGSEENGYVEFIGHPFLASNSSVQMTLSEAADGHWQLEVANPTNNQMTGLHIWNNPYALNWSLNVTGLSVGAGQSVFYNLGTAGE